MPEHDGPGPMPRIGTGHAELDRILGGGFPLHSINVIRGAPGTGKTVLAQQMLFHNADRGRPVVFLSTLSEPLSKVVSYLQHFSFYDESLMLDAVVYEDLGPGLLEEGPEHLLDRVRAIIRERGPSILVIDSFKAVHDLARSTFEMRRLAAELGGMLSAYDVTSFLIGEYGPDPAQAEYPEFAVADGILQLRRTGSAKHDARDLRVLKLRGTSYHEGSHAFTITSNGLEVYPRMIAPDPPEPYAASDERVSTGCAGLDDLLGGGLYRGSSALVLGPAGSGKTTLALGFARQGIAVDEPSLYLNFQENPSQLHRTMRSLGIDVEEHRGQELFLQYHSPVEMQIDAVVLELFRTIEREGIRRVSIDALGDLALAADSVDRFHDYLYSVVQQFAVRGITCMLTLEGYLKTELTQTRPVARFSTLSDVMVSLAVDLDRHPPQRTLRVAKARGIAHPIDARPMVIEKGGIRVLGPPAAS